MASTIPPILIQLQADVSDLKEGLSKAEGAITGVGETVKKQTGFFEKFKATFAGVFAADIGTRGLMAVKNLISDSIADAQNYEKAIAQLNAGLQSTGNVAGLTVTGVKQLASSLEELSGVDENLILSSQTVLQTFTNIRNVAGENNDIFNQASKAALDLSVKMGGDLNGAAMQLGKALNDPIRGMTALRRVGVQFTAEQEEQIKTLMANGDVMSAQKIILEELAVEFGGAAEAAGQTFAGSVARAKDKVADFGRDLVLGLQPILLSIGSTLGDLINKYIKPLIGFLADNKEAVAAFVLVIGTAVTAFGVYKGVLAAVNGVQTLFNAIMAANPIGLTVVALAGLAAAFVTAWNRSETFRNVVLQVAEVALRAFAGLVQVLGNVGTAILNIVTGPLQIFLKGIAKLPGVGDFADTALSTIKKGIDGIGNTADSVVKKTNNLIDKLDDLKDATIKIPSIGPTTVTEAAKAATPAYVVSKEATKAAAKAAEKAAEEAMKTKEAEEEARRAAIAGRFTSTSALFAGATQEEIVASAAGRAAKAVGDTYINVNGYDLSDPNATAQNLVSIAKYGQTITVLTKDISQVATTGLAAARAGFQLVAD